MPCTRHGQKKAMTEVLTLKMLKQKVRDAVLLPANYWSTGTASACSKVKHNQEQHLYLYLYSACSLARKRS